MPTTTFNEIRIGRKFQAPSGIIYKKTSNVRSLPIKDANRIDISSGKTTSLFKNSTIPLTEVV